MLHICMGRQWGSLLDDSQTLFLNVLPLASHKFI